MGWFIALVVTHSALNFSTNATAKRETRRVSFLLGCARVAKFFLQLQLRTGKIKIKPVFTDRKENPALERHGGIDTLVSNAGVNPFLRSTLDASEDVRNKTLQVTVMVLALPVSLVVPHTEKGAGWLVGAGQGLAVLIPPPQALGPYSVSKKALLGLTKALAPERGARNVRINGLAPGIIQTRLSSAVEKSGLLYHCRAPVGDNSRMSV
ncbi:hypothetical protein KIL84_009867 [Mauremys mutica]|uniref:Uncharacterized protein n=1 Tax=Mauremys mutica TaxID=74926 RepID=A0A9D4B5G7_9SAUR|nr:hypothetical protein KIL84_009867 [Mauremys mutica]